MWEEGQDPGSGFGAMVNVDCAICHDPYYDMSKRFYDDQLGQWDFSQADSGERDWNIMQSGEQVVNACYNCHKSGFDAKRGAPFRPDAYGNQDVHYTKNMHCLDCHEWYQDTENASGDECLQCHEGLNHWLARGDGHLDNSANDMPGQEVTCITGGCHNGNFHKDIDGDGDWTLAKHERLSCQICHTPVQKNTIVYRRFRSESPSDVYNVWANDTMPFDSFDVTDAETGESYTVTPYQLRWYAGEQTSSRTRDVYERGKPVFVSRNNPNAKLVPLKHLRAVHYPDMEIEGAFQMSHGTRPAEEAIRDCTYCHEQIRGFIETPDIFDNGGKGGYGHTKTKDTQHDNGNSYATGTSSGNDNDSGGGNSNGKK